MVASAVVGVDVTGVVIVAAVAEMVVDAVVAGAGIGEMEMDSVSLLVFSFMFSYSCECNIRVLMLHKFGHIVDDSSTGFGRKSDTFTTSS